jgi:uncharacterized protein YcaQ
MSSRAISAATARRFLAVRHFLRPPRSVEGGPAGVLKVVDRLGSLQFDPLEVAGRNHDLVLHARVAGYTRAVADTLLYGSRDLYETYNKGLSLVPTADLPFYRIAWDREHQRLAASAFDEHAPLVEELLDRIRSGGPLSSTDIEPRAAIDWYWRPTNQVRAILEALAQAGTLGLANRQGNRRVYDLVERLFPAVLLAERRSAHDQVAFKLLSRYRAHGLLGRSGSAEIWYGTGGIHSGLPVEGAPTRKQLTSELVDGGQLVPVSIEGLRGDRFVVADEVTLLDAAEAEAEVALEGPDGVGANAGVSFLAPLDPLMWDRDFIRRLYGFDYIWEVYVPERKRRWGYYVLPILFGDRLVGRIEPRLDRKAGEVRIIGLWWEEGFDPLACPGFIDELAAALSAYLRFSGMAKVQLPAAARHRDVARALRARLKRTDRDALRESTARPARPDCRTGPRR